MTILVPYRWARAFGCSRADSYRVARAMRLSGGSFTDSMIATGLWTAYRVWAI